MSGDVQMHVSYIAVSMCKCHWKMLNVKMVHIKKKERIESKEKRQILKCKMLELFTFKM